MKSFLLEIILYLATQIQLIPTNRWFLTLLIILKWYLMDNF